MKDEVVWIQKIIFGGLGLGRLSSGKIVFIPFVAPGEKVKVRVTSQKDDYAEGEAVEILEASPYRSDPICKYYGACGGCQLQHITYERQLELKKEMLLEVFQRQGGVSEIPVKEVHPSPQPFHYRNRLRLHVREQDFKLGFVKWKSHQVLRIDQCELAHPQINAFLAYLSENEVFKRLSRYIKRVKIEQSPVDGKVVLLLWSLIDFKGDDLVAFAEYPGLKATFYLRKGVRPVGPFPAHAQDKGRRIFSAPFDLTYYAQPGVFVQTNWSVNLEIQKNIVELARDSERVLDLHAGLGNFILPLAKGLPMVKELVGVDTHPLAIEDGIYTASKNALNGKIDLRTISSHAYLQELIREGKTYDLVILDPPRGGCKDLLKFLPRVTEKMLLYLSCDPPTLARDVKTLLDSGFEMAGIYPFDMFPQSYHLEVLVHLVKKA